MIATKHQLPDKLKLRDLIMQRERTETTPESPQPVSSYILCRDGSLVPIHDEALLAIIEERRLPSRP